MTPAAGTDEQWQVFTKADGEWQDAPRITTRTCTEYEKRAMARQAEEEAVAKAKESQIIVVSGLKAGDVKCCANVALMGVYGDGGYAGGREVCMEEEKGGD
jgi:hypothetical protein